MMARKKNRRRPRIRHGRVLFIDGKPIAGPQAKKILSEHGLSAGSVFSSELMTCLICGARHRSDPRIESDWRAIITGGVTRYFCPAEFPPDDVADEELHKTAYRRCFAAIANACLGAPLDDEIFRPIDWGNVT